MGQSLYTLSDLCAALLDLPGVTHVSLSSCTPLGHEIVVEHRQPGDATQNYGVRDVVREADLSSPGFVDAVYAHLCRAWQHRPA